MKTIKDRLLLAGIKKKDLACLTGRSPTAVSAWGDNPPRYALTILDLLGKLPAAERVAYLKEENKNDKTSQ